MTAGVTIGRPMTDRFTRGRFKRGRFVGRRPRAAVLCAAALLAAPASAELEPADFAGALETARSMPRLNSLLVSHRGDLVLEQYFNGRGRDSTTNVKSVSKTILSALIGVAIDEGHIVGLDQPIADFLGDYYESIDDPRKASITVGDLLSMRSGLETTSFYNYGAWVSSSDWLKFALDRPLVAEPGTRLVYSTGSTHLLSAILTRATGRSSYRFAVEALTRPLGFELSAWDRDPSGIYFGGNNMAFTPGQLLAFGEMYLNGGRHGDRQVIPEGWVALTTTPQVESPRERGRYYGYGWWVRYSAGFRTPYAWGYGGQFVMLVPELDLVAVTTSMSEPGDGRRSHIRRLYRMLENDIVAAAADALGEFRPVPRAPEPNVPTAPVGD